MGKHICQFKKGKHYYICVEKGKGFTRDESPVVFSGTKDERSYNRSISKPVIYRKCPHCDDEFEDISV